MIGQQNLLNNIDKVINKFPRFSIIIGPKGSGKKTLCKQIADKLKSPIINVGTRIEDVRNAIDEAYTQFDTVTFVIADADSMSVAAKNSLLKITEEPPRNSYFIMTLENIDGTLSTLQSRGTVFTLDPYTAAELIQYRRYRGYSEKYDNIVDIVCSTTGDVDSLFSYDVEDFYKFVSNVADNIQVPKSGNAFKITNRIKIKDTDKGFDIKIFLKALEEIFFKKGIQTHKKEYIQASLFTAQTLRDLRYNTVSRLGILDMWIIQVRSVLRDI